MGLVEACIAGDDVVSSRLLICPCTFSSASVFPVLSMSVPVPPRSFSLFSFCFILTFSEMIFIFLWIKRSDDFSKARIIASQNFFTFSSNFMECFDLSM